MPKNTMNIRSHDIFMSLFIEKITNHNEIYALFLNKIKQAIITYSMLRLEHSKYTAR